jgi:O-antigen/teichoic acid export membrane protein
LIAGVILSFPGNQFNTYLASRGQARAQYKLLASALLVELVSLIILARQLGLLGVALAKSILWVWQSLYGWWLVRRFRE